MLWKLLPAFVCCTMGIIVVIIGDATRKTDLPDITTREQEYSSLLTGATLAITGLMWALIVIN